MTLARSKARCLAALLVRGRRSDQRRQRGDPIRRRPVRRLGIRCVAGTLKRIYKGNAAGGAIGFPTGAQPDVHTASANLGFPIVAPVTLYDYAGNAALGFNTTNAGALNWVP